MLKAKEVVSAVGNFQSYPVSSCSWGHLAALLPLSPISSLECGVQVPLLCVSSQPGVLVSPKRINSSAMVCGFFPHTSKTQKPVLRGPADRYVLSLIRVLRKSTDKAGFCLMRGRKGGGRGYGAETGESPSTIPPLYAPLE